MNVVFYIYKKTVIIYLVMMTVYIRHNHRITRESCRKIKIEFERYIVIILTE